MKSSFIVRALLAVLCAGSAGAISLYDTAPMVGLPQSHTARYGAYASVGYDSNMNATHSDQTSSPFVRAGVDASFADYESVDKITYRLNLGMTHYLESSNSRSYGSNSGKQSFADLGATATLVHAFNSRSSYMASLNLTYSPEPDYSTGISASRRQGECFNWAFNNSYNQSIDSRWSWNVNAAYSGLLYSETEYQSDDRQYFTLGAGLSYRASEVLSYKVNFSYKNDRRDYGYNSDNMTLMFGFDRALDPLSSCSVSVGVQQKYIHNESFLSPNIRLGYNRKAAEGFSVNSYAVLSNENVDTYRGANLNYLSDLTLRVGVDGVYTLSPDVSFTFGISVLRAQYSKGTYRMEDETNLTYRPHVGMDYKFSEKLTGNIRYEYTFYDADKHRTNADYSRHVISTGINYTF